MHRFFLCLVIWFISLSGNAQSLRIVSISPSLTELVYDLGFGSNMVGRSDACDYPEPAKKLPIVGSFGKPNLEALARLHPTHILITDIEKPALLDQMKQWDITPLVLPCESWDLLMKAAQTISREMGDAQRGDQWVGHMTKRKSDLMSRVDNFYRDRQKPRVYVEVWGDPLTTAGKKSFLNDVVTLAGGINIGSDIESTYAHISPEWILKENPDVILVSYQRGNAQAIKEQMIRRPGWSDLKAIRNDAICLEIHEDFLARPGPRLIEGAEKLADWLMGEKKSSH